MRPEILILIVIAVAVLAAAALITWFALSRWRSKKLHDKFGSEYDYTLEKAGDQRTAERTLVEREKRVNQLNIHTLDENERDRYQGDWLQIQADFVDDPSKSVKDADRLITEVMIARGFPVADFEQRAEDLSVLYPESVSNYRNAHTIATNNGGNGSHGTSTEDLRQAMVVYHSLFEVLVGPMKVEESKNNGKVKELITQ